MPLSIGPAEKSYLAVPLHHGALKEPFAARGKPDMFNTDQGSQFTSEAFTSVLTRENIRISMDGKSCSHDNGFVERGWRSIKYEEVYLHAPTTVSQAKHVIARHIELYSTRRSHSKLDMQTLNEFYYESLPSLELEAQMNDCGFVCNIDSRLLTTNPKHSNNYID